VAGLSASPEHVAVPARTPGASRSQNLAYFAELLLSDITANYSVRISACLITTPLGAKSYRRVQDETRRRSRKITVQNVEKNSAAALANFARLVVASF
jgi:hypothetical protein